MERWQRSLADSIRNVDQLAARLGVDAGPLRHVAAQYPLQITPYYLNLIREPGDPIWRQCVPDVRELEDINQVADPLNEECLSPVPGLIHRYPDRVVWLVSNRCAVYCRFCMRKRRVGGDFPQPKVEEIIRYIRSRKEIRDVVLSGGDPLLLDDESLEHILILLQGIPHVEIIRIGTRAPVTLPERITRKLCRMLKRYQPLYLNTHFNHPREITPQSASACGMLADAGIPLGNQTVLLKGVNDDPDTMKRLMQLLLSVRVRPYYLHQMDMVRGTGHFKTPLACGLEIMKKLRGHTSGLAVPYYMVDLPGGKGKVPVLPDQVEWTEGKVTFVNYLGEQVDYPDGE